MPLGCFSSLSDWRRYGHSLSRPPNLESQCFDASAHLTLKRNTAVPLACPLPLTGETKTVAGTPGSYSLDKPASIPSARLRRRRWAELCPALLACLIRIANEAKTGGQLPYRSCLDKSAFLPFARYENSIISFTVESKASFFL